MRLFQGMERNTSDILLTQLVNAIVRATLDLPLPRSICELDSDEEDYRWLESFVSRLSSRSVFRWLSSMQSSRNLTKVDDISITYQQGFGAVLLFLFTETARRNAREGTLWPTVFRNLPISAQQLLFVQKQPTQEVKDSLELAARKLMLRHVFGQDGTQSYYATIYLQFGFTGKSIASRLPYWLAGQVTSEAILNLSNENAIRLYSPSFGLLWQALRNYRKNNITERQLRQVAESSPWVLKEWIDDLVLGARARLELGTAESDTVETVDYQEEFLSPPKLRWDGYADPMFTSEVVNLSALPLEKDWYLIVRGDQRLATLVRVDEGVYHCSVESLEFDLTPSKFTLTISDEDGETAMSQVIELWDSVHDIQVFDMANGARHSSETVGISPNRAYTLLTASGLSVEPRGLSWSLVSGTDATLWWIPRGEVRDIRVLAGEYEIWQSNSNKPSASAMAEPDWARDLVPTWTPSNTITAANHIKRIEISGAAEGVRLEYVRVAGRPLEFFDNRGTYITGDFDVTADMLSSASQAGSIITRVALGFSKAGERALVTRTCYLNADCAIRLGNQGWEYVTADKPVTSSEARMQGYKLLPLQSDMSADVYSNLALMEGTVMLKRAWKGVRHIDGISGYGFSMGVRSPYNSMEDEDVLNLAPETHDLGLICKVGNSDHELVIDLTGNIEPGLSYQVVVWDTGSGLQIFDANRIMWRESGEWAVSLVRPLTKFWIVGLAYEGSRIGTCWSIGTDNFRTFLKEQNIDSIQTAAMLRWLRLPIMGETWIDGVMEFALANPLQVLKAWLKKEGLPENWKQKDPNEQWYAVIREVFREWTPEPRQAVELIQAFSDLSDPGRSYEDMIFGIANFMSRVDPLMMQRILKIWLRSIQGPKNGSKEEVLSAVRLASIGLDSRAPVMEIEQGEQKLLKEAAEQMGTDANFIEYGLVRKALAGSGRLGRSERRNLDSALAVGAFREYFSFRIMSSL